MLISLLLETEVMVSGLFPCALLKRKSEKAKKKKSYAIFYTSPESSEDKRTVQKEL